MTVAPRHAFISKGARHTVCSIHSQGAVLTVCSLEVIHIGFFFSSATAGHQVTGHQVTGHQVTAVSLTSCPLQTRTSPPHNDVQAAAISGFKVSNGWQACAVY
jgi:hypothetical protein